TGLDARAARTRCHRGERPVRRAGLRSSRSHAGRLLVDNRPRPAVIAGPPDRGPEIVVEYGNPQLIILRRDRRRHTEDSPAGTPLDAVHARPYGPIRICPPQIAAVIVGERDELR